MIRTTTFLSLLLLGAMGCKDQQASKPASSPPNIVFIMADDHAFQAISAYGHPLGKLAPTPNIDRIAKNGALFTHSFCTNSICGPSRAVILTGKHSHINGFRMNGDRFNGDQPTLPKYLQKIGYKTALVGKWHLYGQPTGFDYWDILNDQGTYYNPQFIHDSDTTIVNGYTTDIIAEKGIGWLQQHSNAGQPFFLMLHHKAPHRNWMPALRHVNRFDSITFPLPDSYFPDFKNQHASVEQEQTIYKDMYEGYDLKMTTGLGTSELAHSPWKTDFERMTPEQRESWDTGYQAKNDAFHKAGLKGKDLAVWKGQRYLQDYLATIVAVDESVGRVLDYLEENGLDENTLVVYTSDQGFYLGENGWFDKRFMYEESLRMPLLMQLPGVIRPGSTIDAMVQNLDFAQTFLELAGGSDYTDGMQGRSFKGLLDGSMDPGNFRDVVYYHYYDFPAFHMVKKHYGIRTRRYKLIHFYDDHDAWEFYDLEEDPEEKHNAISDARYAEIIAAMHRKLDSIQKEYGVTTKEYERAPREKVEQAYKDFKKLRGN